LCAPAYAAPRHEEAPITDQPPPPDQDGLEDYFTDVEHLRDLFRSPRLHPNILLVISGRAVPGWGRQWPEWMAQAEVHELAPMSAAVMHDPSVRQPPYSGRRRSRARRWRLPA